jgi:hypothetical protein
MEVLVVARRMAWVVLIGALLGVAGAYRYSITPSVLRFASSEALWIALSFVGDALLAIVVLLLMVRERDSNTGDE